MSVDKPSVRSLPLATLQMPNVLRSVRPPPARGGFCKGYERAVAPMHAFRVQRGVGVATEILLTKAEQVSDCRARAAGLRLLQQRVSSLLSWQRHSGHDDAAVMEAIVPGHGLGWCGPVVGFPARRSTPIPRKQ